MKMKKKAAFLTAVMMATTGMTGFGVQADTGEGTWDGEVSHVVMTYLTMGTKPADMEKVVEAVNEITIPNIGVEVEFRDIPISDTSSKYSLWISSNEEVDLMMIPYENLQNYADQGLILPLDELLEKNAPYISECAEEYPIYDGSYFQGEVYGVAPVAYSYGIGGSFRLRKDFLDDAGVTYNEGDIYTMDQLTEVFGAMKEAHPDIYPCGIITSGMTSTQANKLNLIYDTLGATASCGVVMGTDSTTVENLYATDEYYNYLSYLKKWYDAGYIYPDAATTDSGGNGLTREGICGGIPGYNSPVMKSDAANNWGKECVQIMLTEPYYTSVSASEGTYWTVPITCRDTDAAVRFLDYTYSNHELCNLILWGIPGEHIEILDEENMLIGYANGYDGSTSPYHNTLGLYGDRRYEYIWSLGNNKAANAAYTEKAMSRPTKAVGYAYDIMKMSTKIANVDAVVQQYVPTLESGTEENLDTLYQEFLAALDKAGINDIIADNQAQFDAWLAER